jgi:hypothetical protein
MLDAFDVSTRNSFHAPKAFSLIWKQGYVHGQNLGVRELLCSLDCPDNSNSVTRKPLQKANSPCTATTSTAMVFEILSSIKKWSTLTLAPESCPETLQRLAPDLVFPPK